MQDTQEWQIKNLLCYKLQNKRKLGYSNFLLFFSLYTILLVKKKEDTKMQLVNFNLSWNEYWSIFVRRLGALIILQIFLYITYRYYKMFSLLKKVKIMSILCDEEIIPFFCFTTMSFFHFNCLPVEKENDNSGIRNRKIYCKMDLYAQYKMQLFLPYIIYESVKNSKKETKNIFLNIEDIDFTIVNNELRKRDDFSLPSRVYIQNSGKEIDEFDRACDAYEMIYDYLNDNYFFNSTIVHSHTKYEMYHYMNYMNARTLRDLFTVDKFR